MCNSGIFCCYKFCFVQSDEIFLRKSSLSVLNLNLHVHVYSKYNIMAHINKIHLLKVRACTCTCSYTKVTQLFKICVFKMICFH